MQEFRHHVESLCSPSSLTRTIPGVVLICNDITGRPVFTQNAGTSSLDPAKARPLSEDSIFWIASCTKLLTSICALQLVERGLISLDDAVGKICPEMATPNILYGFDEHGKPKLRKATGTITLRHLLTHTSGMAYEFLSSDITKWWSSTGRSSKDYEGDIVNFHSAPIVSEPGTQWNYSPALDWTGMIIARLTGEVGLAEYMRKNLFEPLGIKDIAFQKAKLPLREDEMTERWVWMTVRGQNEKRSITSEGAYRSLDPKDDLGGGGIMTSPREYMKVLTSLLQNDGKLLKPETIFDHVFEPQLVEGKVSVMAHRTLLETFITALGARMLTGGLPLPDNELPNGGEMEYQHGLVGLLNRKRGESQWTLSWGALPNLFWWVDPAEGLCGMYASQIIPPADDESLDLAVRWRGNMRHEFGKTSGKSGWGRSAI